MSTQKIDRREFLKLSGSLVASYLGSQILHTDTHPSIFHANDTKNVLIFVFDALPSRQMSLYGYDRSTTPFFKKLAGQALVYHNHYATGNFTVPGTTSLLTGTLPWTHRGYHAFGVPLKRFKQENLFSVFQPTHNTFAASQNSLANILLEDFQDHIDELVPKLEISLNGSLLSSSGHNDDLISKWGELVIRDSDNPLNSSLFFSLFDRQKFMNDLEAYSNQYADRFPYGIPISNSGYTYTLEDVFTKLETKLKAQKPPYLGYIHLWPPHEPYRPSIIQAGRYLDGMKFPEKPLHPLGTDLSPRALEENHTKYDEFIAYLDAEFERFMTRLKASGTLDNTIVILTSDHGQLFERGVHGHETPLLYESLLKIPLLILQPGQTARTDIYSPTSAIDLLPTLASLCGIVPPAWAEGEILPGVEPATQARNRTIFAIEAKENSKFANFSICTIALREGAYKFIYYQGYKNYSDRWELYNLENDPEEMEDLSAVYPQLAKDFREIIINEVETSNQRYLNNQK